MIGIIDYGSGNIGALMNILEHEGIKYKLVSNKTEILEVEKLILPGVSSFDRTMQLLSNRDLIEVLNFMVINKRVPILGICVGMQVMFCESEEGVQKGFGWINGQVNRIPASRLPHMGWNGVARLNASLFNGINVDEGFYFLHSYHCDVKDSLAEVSIAQYEINVSAVVIKRNIVGMQFHPEKSHENGVKIISNYCRYFK